MKNNRMTLQDIANLAGLNKMTVSRYLRDPGQVSQRSRELISKVMEEIVMFMLSVLQAEESAAAFRPPSMLKTIGSKTRKSKAEYYPYLAPTGITP